MHDPATSGCYSTWLPATPETVWAALTCPTATSVFFHGLSLRSTWQPLDNLDLVPTAVGADDTVLHGTVLHAAPTTALSFSIDDCSGTATFVGLGLRPSGEGCVLTLRVDECVSDPDADACELEDVWLPVLDRLRAHLAGRQEPHRA